MRTAIVLALLMAGCSTTWDPHKPKTVNAGEDGGAVTVKHGQRLHLPLAADPGGQYEWRLAEPPVRSGEEQLRLEYRPVSGEGAPQRIVSYDVTVPETGLRAWLRSFFGRRSR